MHWRPGLRRKKPVYHASRRNKEKKKPVITNTITEISKAVEGTKSKISETEKKLT